MVLGLISIILLLFAPIILGSINDMGPLGTVETFYFNPTGIRLLFIYIPSVLFIISRPSPIGPGTE